MTQSKIKIAIQATSRQERFDQMVRTIRRVVPDDQITYSFCPNQKVLAKEIVDADIVVCFSISPEVFSKAQKLAWLHIGSDGIDHTWFHGLQVSDVLITHAENITTIPVAESVFAHLLYLNKQFNQVQKFRQSREWMQWQIAANIRILHGQILGIIGTGQIGGQVARLAEAFGMQVIGLRRQVSSKDAAIPHFHRVYPRSRLHQLLSESDNVVLAVPATDETRGMIGRREFKAMKSSAYLINVARGSIVEEAALIHALEHKIIAGAALDVYASEPLSPGSALFNLPNLFMTPHTAGNYPGYVEAATLDFAEKLKGFLLGHPLTGIIDKSRGY
ncbi:MAG: D-2-hydroxyacid dehydrogenase [Lentisphaeria bacterium]|nr:D-2-hydroxyacid dehydrogenase [Candidatus Neomarinimicrobiota bacterium]MCF7841624.1 D-2-hydroxyacid dehydrogenase [Lentisphaeria bacterium]